MIEPNWPELWEVNEHGWCLERCRDADLTEEETAHAMRNPWKWLEPEIQRKIEEGYIGK